jgi:glycosyltransferase involved in cell wall biosynthesis
MISNRDDMSFLVFSDDWGEHPSSCQHLFRRISKNHKVLWVNTIGMRNPKLALSDLEKAVNKVRKMFAGSGGNAKNDPGAGVVACQPAMLPFIRLPWVRKINCTSVIKNVRSSLARLDMRSPILVATVPNACDYIGNCGESRVVYYCVDDFTQWPGLDTRKIREMEDELIQKSDILIATSHKLYEKLSRSGRPVSLLTHGVDREFFRHTVEQDHALLDLIPKPRVGYFGLFDERSDHDLLAEVALRMPNVSFVITGRVESDKLRQKGVRNVYFTGSVPYAELPAMVKGWDILMLPYAMNVLTDSISPLKLKEYLALGKPVVSTPIPEVVKLRDHVFLASNAQEWEKAIRACLDKPGNGRPKPGEDFWVNETWEKKAQQFLLMCSLRGE